MMSEIAKLAEKNDKKFVKLNELFCRYIGILLHKPEYTNEDADLWFKFMNDCYKNPLLPFYTINMIVDTLLMNSDRPKDRYIIFPVKKDHRGEDVYIAHGFVPRNDSCQSPDWQLREIGLDVWGWNVLVKDTESDRVFRVPLSTFSNSSMITLIAQLRQIIPSNLDTRSSI